MYFSLQKGKKFTDFRNFTDVSKTPDLILQIILIFPFAKLVLNLHV